MKATKHQHGINLPKSLRDHIERDGASSGAHDSLWRSRNKNVTTSRKDTRKQERLERKKRKADYFSAHPISPKRRVEESNGLPQPKRRKTVHFTQATQLVASVQKDDSTSRLHTRSDVLKTLQAKEKMQEKCKNTEHNPSRVAPTSLKRQGILPTSKPREEDEDDACIAYYEAMLGYKGGKRKKSDDLDGLDDLLDFADTIIPYGSTATVDTEEESGIGSVEQLLDLESDSENGSKEVDGVDQDAQQINGDGNAEEVSKDEEEEWGGLCSGFHSMDRDGSQVLLPNLCCRWLYVITARYVSPSLRKQFDSDVDPQELMRLTRQLKGLLNRMSEQNMATVLDSIEELYRKYRRHDVTSTLSTLIIDGIASHAMLLDSFVVLHAAFISSMHKLIGIEFAAFVVQNIIASYEHHLAHAEGAPSNGLETNEDRGKECSNLVVLLSELYNFQVIACVLMYDLIRDLLSKNLSEIRVELLLKILRSSGQQLRQDDPSALKDIVTIAQFSIEKQGSNINSRTRFMMETLTNLKSNKVKKTAAAQHQGSDAVERLKKFLVGLGKKRHGKCMAHEPLRVSLEDLRTAETKGKWWLVGAAWAGDPLVDHQQDASRRETHGVENSTSSVLLKLARKQGMNTDIRRSIFVVLMSSEDYLDAYERLSQLNLTEVQQREIVRVSLHCCGNEKAYNPYYTLLCQHLCQISHSYKITLQYWLWDFLRDLGETNVGGAEVIKNIKEDDDRLEVKSVSSSRLKNTAKAYGWWIAKDTCSLLILKVRLQRDLKFVLIRSIAQPVDFTRLKPQSRKFLKELIAEVFAASQSSSPMLADSTDGQGSRNRGVIEDIFTKAAKLEDLGLGLVYFLSHAFREDEGFLKWGSSVAKEALQVGMDHIPKI
ncbi:hypothetical protein ID866_6565 [Astraeus odoratus]|nr:hypothetical protein ID866_6565 [Astraeus odoratus]